MIIIESRLGELREAVREYLIAELRRHMKAMGFLKVSSENNATLSCVSPDCPDGAHYVRGILGVSSEYFGLSKYSSPEDSQDLQRKLWCRALIFSFALRACHHKGCRGQMLSELRVCCPDKKILTHVFREIGKVIRMETSYLAKFGHYIFPLIHSVACFL